MKTVFRAFQVFVYCLVVAFVGMTLWLFINGELSAQSPKLEYKDFVSILLTGIAVMIAVATVVAAMGALWGYVIIRDEIKRTVEKVATDRAEVIAKKRAEEVARERVDTLVPSLVNEMIYFMQQGEPSKSDEIADEYGREEGSNG
jgi:pheromone shutdown protein TraB